MNFIFIAYIDPGTGAIALQIIMAGLAGAALVFRRSIAAVFGLNKSKDKDAEDEHKDEE